MFRPPKDSHLQLLSVIRKIPRGKVCTYGRVAQLAGLPRRARLVGQVLRTSPLADNVPWHRVINAAGRISPRDRGPARQRQRLEAEGVEFSPSEIIDLSVYLWSPGRAFERMENDK